MYAIMRPNHVEHLKRQRIFFTQDGSNRFGEGHPVVFEEDTVLEPYSALLTGVDLPSIGSFSYSFSNFPSSTRIGRYCSISWDVKVMALNHPMDFVSTSSFSYDPHFVIFKQCLEDDGRSDIPRYGGRAVRPNRNNAPIIGHDVWIGQDVLLARGIEIGTGSVIGAGSVVTRSVPPYAVVGGNPAKVIRFRFDETTVDRLLKSGWWRYRFTTIGSMRYDDPSLFLDQLLDAGQRGDLVPFTPQVIRLKEFFGNG